MTRREARCCNTSPLGAGQSGEDRLEPCELHGDLNGDGLGASCSPPFRARVPRRYIMSKQVNRPARTGRFVSNAAAARWPGKTTRERVGGGTGNSRAVHRSAASGRFVTEAAAKRNPGGTITQRV